MHAVLAAAGRINDDAMVLLAADGRLVDGNQRFLDLYGYGEADLARLNIADFCSEATRDRWSEQWPRAFDAGSASYETEHRRADGSVFPVEVRIKCLEIDGQPGLVAVLRDIGERVRATARIERMTRLYEAVSASNRAVIVSNDEREMCARICRACTDYGMRMAWVGMRQGDKIVPACFSGDGGDYLAGIEIAVGGDDPTARGPTGMAASIGRHVISGDFQNDPSTAPWHERARRYGWRSSAAFPLYRGGAVVGVLTLYSDLINYFGDAETRLIKELASDISFAFDRFDADRERRRLETELKTSRLGILRSLARAGEYRDTDTGAHILRMSYSCQVLAVAAGLPGDFAEMLLHASAMHDVGKIGIPDAILLKPGKLEPHEFEVMKTHTIIGAEMLSVSSDPLVAMARTIALTHHERWDGGGYPHGLRGEDIAIEGRIVAICDVYDALTSARPYKRAWSEEEAVAYIRAGAGHHFDPRLVPLFLDRLDAIREIRQRFVDHGVDSEDAQRKGAPQGP